MPDGSQLDLFMSIFPPSTEAQKIDMPAKLLSRSFEWDAMLARSQARRHIVIHVSRHWTGVVVEQFVDPALGRRMLWHTGAITEYPFTPGARPSRTIYMTAEQAASLHKKLPLVPVDRRHPAGQTWTRFRFAGPGDTPQPTLELPGELA